MKKIQFKYNLLHILYWSANCAYQGYTAIYLQNKGLLNTEVGLVTGLGCILTIVVSPFITSLPQRFQYLTIHRLFDIALICSFTIFLFISYVPLPGAAIMVCYTLMLCIFTSMVPFLSLIATDYIRRGAELNFGLSRGRGSVSYAVSAVLLGQCVTSFNPDILAVMAFIFSNVFLAVLHHMPQNETFHQEHASKGNLLFVIRRYKVLFFSEVSYFEQTKRAVLNKT